MTDTSQTPAPDPWEPSLTSIRIEIAVFGAAVLALAIGNAWMSPIAVCGDGIRCFGGILPSHDTTIPGIVLGAIGIACMGGAWWIGKSGAGCLGSSAPAEDDEEYQDI